VSKGKRKIDTGNGNDPASKGKKSKRNKKKEKVTYETFKPELTKLGMSVSEAIVHIHKDQKLITDGLKSDGINGRGPISRSNILAGFKAPRIVAMHKVFTNVGVSALNTDMNSETTIFIFFFFC